MRKVKLPSELTNTVEQFIVYVQLNEAYFTYIYVYQTNVFEADNSYKNLPPNIISPIFVGLFISALGSGAPPMTQLPATASSVCTTDARLGGVGRVPPPNENPGYAVA